MCVRAHSAHKVIPEKGVVDAFTHSLENRDIISGMNMCVDIEMRALTGINI